jgi:tetratricopeptide (TPR) repeat protein
MGNSLRRLKDLREHLSKDYDLLKQYEDQLRLEDDPQRQGKLAHKIDQLKEQIQIREIELPDGLPQQTFDETKLPSLRQRNETPDIGGSGEALKIGTSQVIAEGVTSEDVEGRQIVRITLANDLLQNYLPAKAPADFVGRAEQINELAEASKSTSMIALIGVLGIGKTALLRAFAAQLPSSVPVFWYEFMPGFVTLESVLTALARFLDSLSGRSSFSRYVNATDLSETEQISLLVSELDRVGVYLFFDRIDLVEGNESLESCFSILKGHLKKGRVFLGSRSKPTFITPLEEAKGGALVISLSGLSKDEVVQYFAGRGVTLHDAGAESLQNNFDGMPLSLELLMALAEEGDDEPALLARADTVRERVVEQLFEELYARLSSTNRQLLTTAALLKLPFTKDRLLGAHRALFSQNASGDFLTLRRRCCLTPVGDSDYFLVHEVIRTLALSNADEDLKELRPNLASHLLADSPDDYMANLEALLLYRDSEDWEEAAEVAGDLIYRRFIPYDLNMAEKVLSIFSEEQVGQERWMWLLGEKGLVADHLRQFGDAGALYQQMLTIAQETKNKRAEALALQRLGALHYDLDDDARAEEYYLRSLALKVELEDPEGQAEIHNNLGSIYSTRGEFLKAAAELEKGLELRRQLESPEWLYIALYSNLGILYARQARWAEASEYSNKALRISEELASPYDTAKSLFNLGKQDVERGNNEMALEKFQRVLEIAEEYQIDELQELAYIATGRVHGDAGDFDQAISYFSRVAALYERFNLKRQLSAIYFDIGTFYQKKEDHFLAFDWYVKGLALFESFTDEQQIELYLKNVRVMAHKLKGETRLRDLVRAIKNLKTRLAAGGPSFALASVYGMLGDIYIEVLDRQRVAVACLRQEISLLSLLQRPRDEVVAGIELAGTLQGCRRYAEALAVLEKALDVAKENDLSDQLGTILYNRGNYYAELQLYPQAEASFREAEQFAPHSDQPNLLQMVHHNLGETFRRQGRLNEAVELLSGVLSHEREANDPYGIIHCLNNLGLAYEEIDQEEDALKCWLEALSVSRGSSLKHEEANALISIGNFFMVSDRPKEAKEYYEQALTVAREIDDSDLEEGCILSLAQVHVDLGTFETIQSDFKRVAERANELGHHASFVKFLTLAGLIDLAEGEVDLAAEMFELAVLFALSRAITLTQQFARSKESPPSAMEISQVLNRILTAIDHALENGMRAQVEKMHEVLMSKLRSHNYWKDGGFPIDYLALIGQFLAEEPPQSIFEYMGEKYRPSAIEDESLG